MQEVGRELWGIVVYLGDHAQHNEGHEIPPLRAFRAGLPS